ncbi:phage antirepressor KilAC domain-containing protein, partial [Idiomarina sp. Sol25]|uniref:phage antirepressor KilAC domain-containing protein n=1 Tax=Idiomarina sp. Sol25 TaxID=3064000 RepID=UPI00294AABF8
QTVEEIAKVLGTGQNRMFAWLRDQRILMASNLPYQRFIDEGYFRTVERQYTDRRGESHTYTRTLVTGKGFAYIQKRFGEERAA